MKKQRTQATALSSADWISESSEGAQPPSNASASPSASSSSSPEKPCSECHIDWVKGEILVAWAQDGLYDATSNVNKSEGGWSPDEWSISPKEKNGVTIDKNSGAVTFGKFGQSVTITGRVKRCPNCKASFTLQIVRLEIGMEQLIPGLFIDVTGKTIAGKEVGNRISFKVSVVPVALEVHIEGREWVLEGPVIKNYTVNSLANPVEPLGPQDMHGETIVFHWIDGDTWECEVSAYIKGLLVSAKTAIQVLRPSAKITAKIDRQPYVVSPLIGDNDRFRLFATWVSFRRNIFVNDGDGITCWSQMFQYTKAIAFRGAVVMDEHPPAGISAGLDAEFTYNANQDYCDDTPFYGLNNVVDKAQYDMDATMYLMYKSNEPRSRWVSLRAVTWSARSRATGTPGVIPANYTLDVQYSSATAALNDRDEIQPPNWERVLVKE